MSSVVDPRSCAPSTSTTAGIMVQPNGQAYVGTINLSIYEARKPPMRLPKSLECNAVEDGEPIDDTTVLVPDVIMSESKKIGCWTARTWTLVVACLSIVSSLVECVMSLREFHYARGQKIVEYALEWKIIISAVDFFMAFLLIFGVHDRSSCAVLLWRCYCCVSTLLIAVAFIPGGSTTPYIIVTAIVLCVRPIFVYVVNIHWKEIRDSPGQNDATRHQDGV